MTQSVRATRRTFARGRCTLAGRTFAFACFTIAGRAGGFSETWTAPPPMMAPPQVQAHNFAKAILTDIIAPCSRLCGGMNKDFPNNPVPRSAKQTDAKDFMERKLVNYIECPKKPQNGCWSIFRPISRHSLQTGERGLAFVRRTIWLTSKSPRIAASSCKRCEDEKESRPYIHAKDRFECLLSDLCSKPAMRIGALGQHR